MIQMLLIIFFCSKGVNTHQCIREILSHPFFPISAFERILKLKFSGSYSKTCPKQTLYTRLNWHQEHSIKKIFEITKTKKSCCRKDLRKIVSSLALWVLWPLTKIFVLLLEEGFPQWHGQIHKQTHRLTWWIVERIGPGSWFGAKVKAVHFLRGEGKSVGRVDNA